MRTFLGLVLALLLCQAAQAFNTLTVRVTVNSSSTFGACWDFVCDKPDQFVVFYGNGGSSQAPVCKSNSVPNIIFIGPAPADWSCTLIVNRPGTLFVGLYDGDGPNGDNTAGQQIDVAPGDALAASVNVENLATTSPNTPRTFSSTGNDGTISFTVTALINPGQLTGLTSDMTSFRPSLGEQIRVTASATGAPYTFQRLKAYNSAGAEVWNIFGYLDTPGQTSKQYVWQGRDPYGNPLPAGTYTVKYQAFDSVTNIAAIGPLPDGTVAPGGTLTRTITILPPPLLPTLSVPSIFPSPKWAPDVGDLAIRVASNATTQVSGEVYGNSSCTGTKLADLNPVTVQPSFTGNLTWTGQTAMGGSFTPGPYGIKVSGVSNGAATSPASLCRTIELIAAPPAILYTQHLPFIAEPGQTVEITARSVDATGAPRLAGRLDVFTSMQSVPGAAPAPPAAPVRTCFMATSCTATLTLPTGQSFFTWRATAADRAGTAVADSGWRGQRVMDRNSFANMTGFAMPVDIAMTGPLMSNMRDTRFSHDLVFSVSTDYSWTSTTDRGDIAMSLDRFMSRLWGIEGNGAPAPTSFLMRPDLVRVYLVPERNVVSWNPQANLCDWRVPGIAWADATAILHKTNCRDNADTSSRSFSAKLNARDVVMHELHHALIGLADEYTDSMGLGDGGYFESGPFPNVYNLMTDCQAQAGREPGGCSTITEIDTVTRMPTGRTFFRLDASRPDIMFENGTQRFGDTRRAVWKESVCDAGGC
ncbi:MAG TPA: hypothetical protein VFZ95_00860 [Steroidobacteraceae bacterium]